MCHIIDIHVKGTGTGMKMNIKINKLNESTKICVPISLYHRLMEESFRTNSNIDGRTQLCCLCYL